MSVGGRMLGLAGGVVAVNKKTGAIVNTRQTKPITVESLTGKGIIAWEVDGVLARLTKAQSREDKIDLQKSIRPIVSLAAMLAVRVRERVRDEGQTAEGNPWGGYSTRGKAGLSPLYAQAAGVGDGTGARWFRDSRTMHDAVGRGLFTGSGAMWDSLQARPGGKNTAIIDAQGSSLGRGKIIKTHVPVVHKGGKVSASRKMVEKRVLANVKVRNQDKMGAIRETAKVHVLQPTKAEVIALAEAVAGDAASQVFQQFEAGAVDTTWTGDAKLRTRLLIGG